MWVFRIGLGVRDWLVEVEVGVRIDTRIDTRELMRIDRGFRFLDVSKQDKKDFPPSFVGL